MNSTQDRPRPGAGDICPDLGGPAITGPLEITWAEGLEELRNIRQATDRCAGYLMDIRHILGQIASTSGQMADAMQRIHDGMDHLQGDIASAADTIPYIADCVCRGLSTQIEAADRPPLTWEGQWSQAVDTYRPTEGIAAILAPIYIRRMEITYAGYIPQVMGEICACRRLQEWPWWKYIRNVWPPMETGGTRAYIMLQRFNPRSPWGERHLYSPDWASPASFQSTLPVGGATVAGGLMTASTICFNPRSPWGERPIPTTIYWGGKRFQSTLPVGGATVWACQH